MKVAFTTLGCKVNQYDTATFRDAVLRQGDDVVPFAEGAEVYVINTCTVTDRADAESRRLVRRARRWNPAARVIVTGCFAQTSPERVAELPEVDHVIGIGKLPEILRVVRGEGDGGRVMVNDVGRARRVETLGAGHFDGQTRAFLKVQEGCDLFCTFCIVPRARGRSRSVEPRRVLREMERLAAAGYQEIVLSGIHLGGYGADLSPRIDLADLLEMIDELRPAPRVRLSSLDPPEVTSRLLRIMQTSDIICPYLHIPVQAGDDGVLRRMRRKYDTSLVRDVVAEFRCRLPRAGLGTDVIAGFPGESEREFSCGHELLAALSFDYFHVFPYSRRSGTTAAKAVDQLPSAVITARARTLRELGQRRRNRWAAGWVGHDMRVLVETTRDRGSGMLIGYSREYVRVLVPDGIGCAGREVRVRGLRRSGGRVVAKVAEG